MNYLLACGDASKIETWSNIPYYFFQAARNQHLIDSCIPIHTPSFSLKRLFWHVRQFFLTGSLYGYQYSTSFSFDCLRKFVHLDTSDNLIISHYPHFPYDVFSSVQVIYYIDATSRQIHDHYFPNRIGPAYRTSIYRREVRSYQNSLHIFCMSEWAAHSVISDYGINPDKVTVVPAGANLPENSIHNCDLYNFPPQPSSQNPLTLGFLGKDWVRKGGPFLLDVINDLNSKGVPARLRVIGLSSSQTPSSPFIDNVGFLSKSESLHVFINEVVSWHFGTLFSEAEAFGISNRECLRLGVPILTHDVGGIKSTIPPFPFGMCFPEHPTVSSVVTFIRASMEAYSDYLLLRTSLIEHSYYFTWQQTVSDINSKLSSILL